MPGRAHVYRKGQEDRKDTVSGRLTSYHLGPVAIRSIRCWLNARVSSEIAAAPNLLASSVRALDAIVKNTVVLASQTA